MSHRITNHRVRHRRRPPRGRSLLLALTLSAAIIASAHADEPWLVTAEAPAAVPVSAPQRTLFGLGGMPSIAVYRGATPWLLIGARVRAGALSSGDAPMTPGVMDPAIGGLGSVTLAMRARPLGARARAGGGLWLELAGGGAITGDDTRPTLEAGLGWGFALGAVTLGPSARLLYVRQADAPLALRDAGLVLVGLELGLSRQRHRGRERLAIAAPIAAPAEAVRDTDSDGDGVVDSADACPDEAEDIDGFADADGCPELDNDGDGVIDAMDQCADTAEVINGVDDHDGCPDEGEIVLEDDRVVLEEQVLFDTARARVKRKARRKLAAIVALWQQHPEWGSMIIEGHTDERGGDEYNQWLSQTRADRAKEALIELGMPAARVEAVGFGKSRPRDTSDSRTRHERNRRVEFVVVPRASRSER